MFIHLHKPFNGIFNFNHYLVTVLLDNSEEVSFHPVLKIPVPDNIDHPHPDFLEILVIQRETVIGEKFPVDGIDVFTFDETIMT